MQPKVCPRRGVYFVMNRQELLGFFLQKRRINTIFCGECQKDECYDCKRFYYIRNQLEKNALKNKLDQRVSRGRTNRFCGRFLTIF